MKAPWDGDWNAVRYRAGGGDHVESYFFRATAPDAKRALWLKATILHAGADPAGATADGWAIAFDHRQDERRSIAVKHTVPLASATFDERTLGVDWEMADSKDRLHVENGATQGAVTTGKHRIEWDLRFEGQDRPLVLYPYAKMYTGPFPSQKTVATHPDQRFSGQLTVDGEGWAIDEWKGGQGHNWGKGHTELYVWSQCNQWDQDADFAIGAASGRVRLGPVLLPVLSSICVRHGGIDYPFNGLVQLVGTRADIGLRRYTFSGKTKQATIEGLFEAPVGDFMGLYYPNPQGAQTHCLNCKLASGRIRFEPRGKTPLDLTTKAAALEVGTLKEDHGVKMHV